VKEVKAQIWLSEKTNVPIVCRSEVGCEERDERPETSEHHRADGDDRDDHRVL
jgi:hypothetical protein